MRMLYINNVMQKKINVNSEFWLWITLIEWLKFLLPNLELIGSIL
jgi:hypothetical protein